MRQFNNTHRALTALAAALTFTACSTSTDDSRPRLNSIPAQVTTGGSTFSLDLSTFVTETDGQPVTYSVESGGGSFAGSTYSNVFDALGEYTVRFAVSDGLKGVNGEFDVRVTTSNFAAVKAGTSLALLDTDTGKFLQVSSADSPETFKAGLSIGHLVFERTTSGNVDLFVHDPLTRTTYALGEDPDLDEVYRGKTSDNQVLFRTTPRTASQGDLFLWSPTTMTSRIVRAVEGQDDGTALVMANNDIALEGDVDGVAEIFVYDTSEDTLIRITTTAGAETLVGVTANGLVFSGRGSASEVDLFYWSPGTGLLEVGADISTLESVSKTYRAFDGAEKIVFTAPVSGVTNVWFWDPATGVSTNASAGTVALENTFHAVTGEGHVVFSADDTGASAVDLYVRQLLTTATTAAVPNAGNDTDTFRSVAVDTSVPYVVFSRNTTIGVYNVSGATTDIETNGAGLTFADTLVNGDVVLVAGDASAIFHYDPATGTSTSAGTGTTVTYAGEGPNDGDFAYTKVVSAQTDLFFYDLSTTTEETVSADAAADTFQASALGGQILFTRPVGTNTTVDLFRWTAGSPATVEQLTPVFTGATAVDHSVVGTYAATRVQ